MNTQVKFYHGTKSMGVVVSVSYDKDRIIFDFGAPFTPLTEVYDGIVLRRKDHRLIDSLLLGKVPYVEGVFSKDLLQDICLQSYEDSDKNTAVFICHLHLDHMSEIDKIHPNIPVYIHKEALKLENALEEIGEDIHYRDYNPFEYYQTIEVGKIKVTPYFSDHTCIGSAGFLIETPDANVYYSGDIRFHGIENERAFKEIEKVTKHNIDLLIVDATTTSPSEFSFDDSLKELYGKASKDILPGSITEKDIYADTENKLKGYQGLGIFNLYHRDIRMLDYMIKIAENTERKCVFEPKTAYIVYKLLNIQPNVYWPDVCEEYHFKEELSENSTAVTIKEMKNNPKGYFLQNSYANILSLIDLEGIKAKYFHLFGEPLTKGTKQYQIMLNMLDKLGFEFNTYANLYSFSHAYPNHLAYFVEGINAKCVVGVHTKNPEKMIVNKGKQFFPEEMKTYDLVNGELISSE